MNYLNLMDGNYALKFPYHMVTPMTVEMALPKELKKLGKPVRFAAEGNTTAGKKRMNSEEIQRGFPIEVALLKQAGHNPADYILVHIR